MRVLLLGGTGQVGRECLELDRLDVECVAPDSAALDLSRPQTIAEAIASGPWGIVINAAAYTPGRPRRKRARRAFRPESPTRRICLPKQRKSTTSPSSISRPITSSTGIRERPMSKAIRRRRSMCMNGESTLAGERAIAAANPRHVIIRTAWVYSPHSHNFVKAVLGLAERDQLTIVNEQRSAPTAARDIAAVCRDFALRSCADRKHAPYGIYHYCAKGETTWFGFAKAILEMASRRGRRVPHLVPIATDYPAPARRPLDTRLDCAAIFGVGQRPWRKALRETLAELLPNGK